MLKSQRGGLLKKRSLTLRKGKTSGSSDKPSTSDRTRYDQYSDCLDGGNGSSYAKKIIILVSIIMTFLICYYIFQFSRVIHKLIGYNGMLVFTRLMGLLLAALAVDLTVKGIINIYQLTV